LRNEPDPAGGIEGAEGKGASAEGTVLGMWPRRNGGHQKKRKKAKNTPKKKKNPKKPNNPPKTPPPRGEFRRAAQAND